MAVVESDNLYQYSLSVKTKTRKRDPLFERRHSEEMKEKLIFYIKFAIE